MSQDPPRRGSPAYARVIVDVQPAHLDRPFDYLVPEGTDVEVGQRVRVVFSGRRRNGWVIDTADSPDTDPERVRELSLLLGADRWFDREDLRLYRWVAERWAGSLADVLRHALPPRVAAVEHEAAAWGPPSPRVVAGRPPCPASAWRPYAASRMLRAAAGSEGTFWWRLLPGDDTAALVGDLVVRCVAGGRSALVLVPDQADRLADEVVELAGPAAGADFRGDERSRHRAFLRCRTGHARVAVGERSAVFAPLRDLGLVVVIDEANPAYKERRNPRHHAREVALTRARFAGAACVLTGDLPSARLWSLLRDGHVEEVRVDRSDERARAPTVVVADLTEPRPAARRTRLSDAAVRALGETVAGGGAAAVVVARRGEGTALACRRCGSRRACPTCEGPLRPLSAGEWACRACDWRGPPSVCPACGAVEASPLAAGAGRLAAELQRSYPGAEVTRMEGFDAPGPQQRPAIAVMTRGSAVRRPDWLGGEAATVVLADPDAHLRRPRADAAEDALRLWFAVSRWAVGQGGGASPAAGRVVLQTREPRHPAVQALVRWDPAGFWEGETERRAELRYPPAGSLVRLRVAAGVAARAAVDLRERLGSDAEVLGPDPEGAILVKTADLRGTLSALRTMRRDWSKAGHSVQVDVDPVELT